ncbi:MAG: response regulator, partial [Nitrospirales bacterium]
MAPRDSRAGGVVPQNPFPSHRTKPGDSPPPTVLIAEDSPTQAQHLRLLLEDRGYRVLVAKHGRQALDLLRTNSPALIISDVMMPEVDGFALC